MLIGSKILVAGGLFAMAGIANAGYDIKLSDKDKVSFGGYIKVDARYVDGDVGYRDF